MGTKVMKETKAIVKTGYQVPDWWYDIRGFFIFKLCYQDRLIPTIRFFAKNISDKHLEVAVGSGSFLDLCLKYNAITGGPKGKGTAFDYTPEMLKGAHRNLNKHWQVEQADVTKMPYKDNYYKTINVANAFHCFPETQKAAIELYRVMAPGGTLAVNIVTPPRGMKWARKISLSIINWGKKNSIIEESISYEDSIKILTSVGFHVEKEIWKGNNLRILLSK